MSHISKLTTQHFAGRSASHDLAPITVVTGPNMAGKTKILKAIVIALQGFDPALGKSPGAGRRPADTWVYAGAPGYPAKRMATKIETDNGARNEFTLTRKGDKIEAQWLRQDIVVPSVLTDSGEFIRLGAKDRTRFVVPLLDMSKLGLSLASMTARLAGEIAIADTDTKAEVTAVTDILGDLDRERHDTGGTYQQVIDEAIEAIKLRGAEAKNTVTAMTGMAQGAVQLSADVTPPRPVDQAKLDTARTELATAKADMQAAMTHNHALAQRQKEIAAARNFLADHQREDCEGRLRDLEKQVAEIKAEIGDRKPADLTTLIRAESEATSKIATAQREAKRLQAEAEKETAKRDKMLAEKCCPTCKNETDDWRKSFTKAANKEIAALEKKATAQTDTLPLQRGMLENTQKAIAAIKKTNAELEELDSRLRDVDSKRFGMVLQLDQITKAETTLGKPGDSEPRDVTGIATRVNTLTDQVRALEEQDRAHTRHQAQQQTVAQSALKRQEAETRQEVCRQAVKILDTIKGEAMAKGFGQFLAKVNAFTDGIIEGSLAFVDGELGVRRGADWITFELLSGTENLLVCAGLAVALAGQCPLRIVLLEELGRLADETKEKVVNRMEKLISDGVIDQCIGVDVDRSFYDRYNSAYAPKPEFAIIDLSPDAPKDSGK